MPPLRAFLRGRLNWPRKRPRQFWPRGKSELHLFCPKSVLKFLYDGWRKVRLVEAWPRGQLRTDDNVILIRDEGNRVRPPKAKSGLEAPTHLASLETAILKSVFPIVEHCAVARYDDGTSRLTGFIQMGTKGRDWFLRVKDPQTQLSFESRGEDLDTVLLSVAVLLSSEDCPWEADPFLNGTVAGKKKKG